MLPHQPSLPAVQPAAATSPTAPVASPIATQQARPAITVPQIGANSEAQPKPADYGEHSTERSGYGQNAYIPGSNGRGNLVAAGSETSPSAGGVFRESTINTEAIQPRSETAIEAQDLKETIKAELKAELTAEVSSNVTRAMDLRFRSMERDIKRDVNDTLKTEVRGLVAGMKQEMTGLRKDTLTQGMTRLGDFHITGFSEDGTLVNAVSPTEKEITLTMDEAVFIAGKAGKVTGIRSDLGVVTFSDNWYIDDTRVDAGNREVAMRARAKRAVAAAKTESKPKSSQSRKQLFISSNERNSNLDTRWRLSTIESGSNGQGR